MKSLKTYQYKGMMLFCLVFILPLCGVVKAQSDTTKRPYLGGHVFTPVTYSNTPFTNTYVSIFTGFGQTTDLVHQLGSIGNYQPRGLAGEVTFINMGLSYQQQVREWLAAYISLSISARVGTELQSILSQGINSLMSFNIGWNIKLVEREKFVLSTIVELQNHQGSFINVLKYVKELINNHPNPSISENIPVLAFASGFRFAYGLNDLIGFKASTDLAYGETYIRGENGFAFNVGGGIDLDFYPRYSLPVGVMMYYNITSMPDFVYVDGEYGQMVKAKIAYTKSTEFSLGVEYSYMKVPLLNQQNAAVQSITLTMRFYF